MLALLSPAKKLSIDSASIRVASTQPALLGEVELLMRTTRKLSKAQLQELMGISEKLAQLNHDRFQSLQFPFTPENAQPAALCFAGDTYVGLDASSLSEPDLLWGQDTLAILSGLYGLLRPLDLMQPYRLEMGTSLTNPRGSNLYDFWKSSITKEIHSRLEGHVDNTLVNLASNEYFKAVNPKSVPGRIITPVFLEEKDGKARTVSFMAKRARGSMARFMLTERLQSPEGLKDFQLGDYRFDSSLSDDSRWVFRRPQPPPASKR